MHTWRKSQEKTCNLQNSSALFSTVGAWDLGGVVAISMPGPVGSGRWSSLFTELTLDFNSSDNALRKSPPAGPRVLSTGRLGGCLGPSASTSLLSLLVAFGSTGSSLRFMPETTQALSPPLLCPSPALPSILCGTSVFGTPNPKDPMPVPNAGILLSDWDWRLWAVKLKVDGVVGSEAAVLLLEGLAGWEKVNWMLLPPPSISFCEEFALENKTEGAVAGCEKLKPRVLGFTHENSEPLEEFSIVLVMGLDDPTVSEAEDRFELGGSGLMLKIGLKMASLGGLKPNWFTPVGLSVLHPVEELDVAVGTERAESWPKLCWLVTVLLKVVRDCEALEERPNAEDWPKAGAWSKADIWFCPVAWEYEGGGCPKPSVPWPKLDCPKGRGCF